MINKKVLKLDSHKQYLFVVVGISSQEPIFIVSNDLNRSLTISLEKLQTVVSFDGKTKKRFNAYSYFSDESNFFYSLISNRGTDGFLFDKLRILDYFFVISTENQLANKEEIIKKIKDSKYFLSVSNVTINNTKENKIFREIVAQLWG
jgi:hypothetical protein